MPALIGTRRAAVLRRRASAAAGGGGPSPLLDGLVGYWAMQEASGTLTDSSVNGRDFNSGFPGYGAVTYGQTGKSGNCVQGAGGGAGRARNAKFLSTGDCSVFGWFKVTTASGDCYLYRQQDGGGGTFPYLIAGDSGTVGIIQAHVASGQSITHVGAGAFRGAGFLHIGFTYKHATGALAIYLNGSQVESGTKTASFGNATYSGFILADTANYLDELAVWSVQLSGANVTSLYNADAGLFYPFS